MSSRNCQNVAALDLKLPDSVCQAYNRPVELYVRNFQAIRGLNQINPGAKADHVQNPVRIETCRKEETQTNRHRIFRLKIPGRRTAKKRQRTVSGQIQCRKANTRAMPTQTGPKTFWRPNKPCQRLKVQSV
ncbi:MAG: hypothetical protein LBP22_17580 [Deltaproteobacteria bacterium]|nr:hypothetical protein [Deltaproteobacteria bacterium]